MSNAVSSESFQRTFESLFSRRRDGSRSNTFPHIVAAPIYYESGYSYPLLVWLHDAEKSELDLFDVTPRLSTRNYVTVAPRGLVRQKKRVIRSIVNDRQIEEKCWFEPCNDWPSDKDSISEAENLVFDAISEARSKYNINPRNIFILGHGTGGVMAMRIAMRYPYDFAGVVSIDGVSESLSSLPLPSWRSHQNLPILMTVGDRRSTTVPHLSASLARLLHLYHTAGLNVLVRQYNEEGTDQDSLQARMDNVLADVNRWIMEHALPPQSPPSNFFRYAS